jgi:hypothetical protein
MLTSGWLIKTCPENGRAAEFRHGATPISVKKMAEKAQHICQINRSDKIINNE